MDKLRQLLEQRMKNMIPEQVLIATVDSVDRNNFTIDATLTGTEIQVTGIRLSPAADSNATGVIAIPKIGSLVMIGMISNLIGASFMIMCHECDEIIIRGGSEGGLVKVNELKKQLGKDTDILKALLNVIAGPTIPEPGNGAASAFQAVLKSQLTGKVPGDYSQIENDKVSHG